MVKQKLKKAEKSKVKLKTTLKSKTNFLPKGGNVTNTNFKVKPIIIQEQLKAKDLKEPLSSRKLTFKELLTRLNHHNVNVRFDGCNGLLELLNVSSQEIVEMQLHALLLGATKLFLDTESKVRRHAIKLVTELVAKVPNVKLTPFFDILISYTACAMTHLDINIQEDSLLVIDVFLNHIPVLIFKHHLRLFPNFLTLISKLRNESTSRMLVTDLRSSATSIKWRAKVLHRLRGILRAITKNNAEKKAPVKTLLAKDSSNYIPLYKGFRSCSSDFLRVTEKVSNADDLTEHIDVLLPLLYDIWAEAIQAKKKFDDENTMIDYDVAAILSCSLGVFHLLWEYATKIDKQQRQRFLSKNNQKYFNHVLTFFPYQLKQASSTDLLLDIEPKLANENLLVCFMFCTLIKDLVRIEVFRQKTEDVVHYLKTCLVNRNYVKCGEMPILLSSLRLIFFEHYVIWRQCQLDFEDLLNGVVHFYQYNHAGNDELFRLLSDMMQVPELKCINSYKRWLRSVPKLLCRPKISLDVLNCISRLSRQGDCSFAETVSTNLQPILNNIFTIEVIGTDAYPCTWKIAHIINTLESFSTANLTYLRHFIKSCRDEDLKLCLLNIVREKESVM